MTTAQVTPYQVGLLHHTLGLSERRRESFRNYFVASEGHSDFRHLEALESAGLMARGPTPGFLNAGDIVFMATDAGREKATAALPAPRKLTRYQEYLRADGCRGESFGDFLCNGKLPEFESREGPFYSLSHPNHHLSRRRQYRMFRYEYFQDEFGWDKYREIEGEWCYSQKEAKASYKAALKAKKASK